MCDNDERLSALAKEIINTMPLPYITFVYIAATSQGVGVRRQRASLSTTCGRPSQDANCVKIEEIEFRVQSPDRRLFYNT
jgi:hypothetical protein